MTAVNERLRRAYQVLLDKERLHAGSGRDGHLSENDLAPLGAAIGALARVNTNWFAEVKYPRWDSPEIWHSDEKTARHRVAYHRSRGAKTRLLKQEIYAGPQEEVPA